MKRNIKVQGNKKEFVWGPVVKVHEIGEYSIVEYRPQIFKDSCGTGKYEEEKTNFHPYINGKDTNRSFESLDDAIIGTICYKVDSNNTRLDVYINTLLRTLAEASQ